MIEGQQMLDKRPKGDIDDVCDQRTWKLEHDPESGYRFFRKDHAQNNKA